jgi:hypothetical protein
MLFEFLTLVRISRSVPRRQEGMDALGFCDSIPLGDVFYNFALAGFNGSTNNDPATVRCFKQW